MKILLLLLLLAAGIPAAADEDLVLCYNWSCAAETTLHLAENFLQDLGELLIDADSPAHERELLAVAIGRIYGLAARETVLGADRAGNRDDAEVDGRMDCIDHSNNTTSVLGLFARREWMRFHRPAEPVFRKRLLFSQHRTAVIEELPPGLGVVGGDANEQFAGARYAIDSWFVDPGETPVVMPLLEWLEGGGPDVH